MNVLLRWHSGWIAVCLGMCCWFSNNTSPLQAQTPRSNPLRQVEVKPVDDALNVTRASANVPVRAAVHSEPRIVTRTTSSPQSNVQEPAPFSYGSRVTRRELRGFVPRHAQVASLQTTEEMVVEPFPPDGSSEVIMDSTEVPGEPLAADYCDQPAADCGGCGQCNGCLIPCPVLALDNIELFAGTEGFTGPLNRGETGSFGFHYGVNWGAPVACMPNQPIGVQIGYRGVSSNLSGASFTEESRRQSFLTGGLFRRVDWGLQGGVVVDIVSDKWYYDDLTLTQLRGELSWVFPQCHELGFFFTSGLRTNSVSLSTWVDGQQRTVIEEYEATDLMAFFYRRRFEAVGGGYGRLFAGFTGSSGGLIGADFDLPMTENWALKTGFTYLIPQDGNNHVAYLDEAWNVAISLVWYPGRRKAVGNDYFRPLFDVADNGIFIPRASTP
ncbi:MAG: DUF6666 family protein [Pirellulaceae bacterium]